MARPLCRNAGTIRKLDNSMDWLILVAAGCMETIWAVLLKYTHGFTRFWPTAATLAAMAVSFWLLALALKTLPMGTAYVVWTGIGAVGWGWSAFCASARPPPGPGSPAWP